MSIQFGDIHNLVRTYQRVLDLDQHEPVVRPAESVSDSEVRVSISPRARELARALRPDDRDPDSAFTG